MSDKEKNIKQVISNLFTNDKRLSRGYNEYNMETLWRATFGEMISRYTTQVRFQKGHLTVYITSSSLKQELSLNKQAIIDKLNQSLKYNKVETIRIC